MNNEQIIGLLQEQLLYYKERDREQSALIKSMSLQLASQSDQIESLIKSLHSLEQTLAQKEVSLVKASNKNSGLARLIANKSEKQPIPVVSHTPDTPVAPSPKERGNNNARRKQHLQIGVEEHDIYPSARDFCIDQGKYLKTVNSIRYEYIPPKFIKHVYHRHYYLFQDRILAGEVPATPLLNSNYEASFIAAILQMRYIYSMPVERIVKYLNENGFDINKSTAHGLVKKTAQLLDSFEEVLAKAVREDDYLHMDESYYTVLEKSQKNNSQKTSCKVYIWAALAKHINLVHFFYENGSRARKVLTDYIKPEYRGAIQSDGLGNYKILETDEYPHVIRLGCFQHCKRKFLDIKGDANAEEVVGIINRLYRQEHKIPSGYSPGQVMEHKKKYATPILEELKRKLLELKADKTVLPKSALGRAVNYALNEYPALANYLLKPEYELDNNAIERINRYISLSRRNSLFCGSHQGAKRAALIYSLACSCRLNGINTFDYFKDILNRFIEVKPNTDREYIRALLPDKWKKA